MPLLSRVLRNAALRILGTDGWRLGADHIEAMMNIVKTPGAGRAATLPCSLRMLKKYEEIVIERTETTATNSSDETAPIESAILIRDGATVPDGFPFEFYMSVIALQSGADSDKHAAGIKTEIKSNRDPMTAYFDRDLLKDSLRIRYWEQGDSFQPLGMEGEKLLSDFFTDARIDRDARTETPLLLDGNDIIWVAGRRISHKYRITDQTRKVLKVTMKTVQGA
jgi:tRNA(Ile)-lysidine synthase